MNTNKDSHLIPVKDHPPFFFNFFFVTLFNYCFIKLFNYGQKT